MELLLMSTAARFVLLEPADRRVQVLCTRSRSQRR